MSFRIDQVNALIQRDLGMIMSKELELPEGAFVTVTKAETSRNLKKSNIFVTILPEKERDDIFILLKKNTSRLQKELSKGMTMKFTPKIEFFIDEIEENASRIESLLDSLKE